MPLDTKEIGRRIIRSQEHGPQAFGHCLQFAQIGGSLAEQEIEIQGGYRRPVQCGGSIADHDGLEVFVVEYTGKREKYGARVHAARLIVRLCCRYVPPVPNVPMVCAFWL